MHRRVEKDIEGFINEVNDGENSTEIISKKAYETLSEEEKSNYTYHDGWVRKNIINPKELQESDLYKLLLLDMRKNIKIIRNSIIFFVILTCVAILVGIFLPR